MLQVETPNLHTSAGGALASPFTTHMAATDATAFLRIAPELFLKVRLKSFLTVGTTMVGYDFL